MPSNALCYLYIGEKTDFLVWEVIEIKNKGKCADHDECFEGNEESSVVGNKGRGSKVAVNFLTKIIFSDCIFAVSSFGLFSLSLFFMIFIPTLYQLFFSLILTHKPVSTCSLYLKKANEFALCDFWTSGFSTCQLRNLAQASSWFLHT